MSDCKHKVVFYENYNKSFKNLIAISRWSIGAQCPDCHKDISDDEVVLTMKRVYAPEIAKLVIKCYEHKKAYYEAITELSANGVTCILFPPDRIECPS